MKRLILPLLAAVLAAVAFTGCAPQKGVTAEPPKAERADQAGGANDQATEEPAGSNVTKVGKWATAEDGLAFRVSKLTRSRVGQYAAGGRPGDPAVVATVQIRNGSKQRFDLALSTITVRFGSDGRQAEESFDDTHGGTPNGTLSPGRTSTHKYKFAAESAGDLKKVSVEIAPGLEYDSFTFEGSL